MAKHSECGHKPGVFVVYRQGGRWQVIIWGGDGEHPMDGAEFDTWPEAIHYTGEAVTILKQGNVALCRSVLRAQGRWCDTHGTWTPCPGEPTECRIPAPGELTEC